MTLFLQPNLACVLSLLERHSGSWVFWEGWNGAKVFRTVRFLKILVNDWYFFTFSFLIYPSSFGTFTMLFPFSFYDSIPTRRNHRTRTTSMKSHIATTTTTTHSNLEQNATSSDAATPRRKIESMKKWWRLVSGVREMS